MRGLAGKRRLWNGGRKVKSPGGKIPVGFDNEHMQAMREVMARLDELQVASMASPDVVEIYVRNLVRMRRAEAHIAEHGIMVKAPRTGNPIENPHLKIVDRCAQTVVKCARALQIG